MDRVPRSREGAARSSIKSASLQETDAPNRNVVGGQKVGGRAAAMMREEREREERENAELEAAAKAAAEEDRRAAREARKKQKRKSSSWCCAAASSDDESGVDEGKGDVGVGPSAAEASPKVGYASGSGRRASSRRSSRNERKTPSPPPAPAAVNKVEANEEDAVQALRPVQSDDFPSSRPSNNNGERRSRAPSFVPGPDTGSRRSFVGTNHANETAPMPGGFDDSNDDATPPRHQRSSLRSNSTDGRFGSSGNAIGGSRRKSGIMATASLDHIQSGSSQRRSFMQGDGAAAMPLSNNSSAGNSPARNPLMVQHRNSAVADGSSSNGGDAVYGGGGHHSQAHSLVRDF